MWKREAEKEVRVIPCDEISLCCCSRVQKVGREPWDVGSR